MKERNSGPKRGIAYDPMIHAMVRRDGFSVKHKRTERLYYKVLRLNLRLKRRRKRFRSETRVPIEQPEAVNKVWSMGFIYRMWGAKALSP